MTRVRPLRRVIAVSDTENERNLSSARGILELAHRYAQSGKIYQAADMYQRLMRKYPKSPEGQEARRRILEIAKRHEADGRRRLALSLYEKVEAFPDAQESGGKERAPAFEEETIRVVVRKTTKEVVGGVMAEIPFVDLREDVDMEQNFERLGRVQTSRVDIPRTVSSLKELKGRCLR